MSNRQFDLKALLGMAGKRVLVIGGGQGIGEATARLLADLGCDVAIADLDIQRVTRVCASIAQSGIATYPLALDVTHEDALVAAFGRIEREFGLLDAMVAVVGAAGWSPIVAMTSATWDLDHRRNLRYFFIAARELARGLLQRGATGSIVAVSSVDGTRSAPHHAAYGAAKAGLIHLVMTMASEWSEHGIRVNCVAPGPIVTERVPLGDPQQEYHAMTPVPMRRRGTGEEVANAAIFLLSNMSTYVTGHTLAVDGGYVSAWGFGASR